MKKKVNINRPDVSSEEILKRKNFDSVLKQHTVISKPFYKNPWFLSGGGIAIVAAVTAIVLQINNNPEATLPKATNQPLAADSILLADFYKAEEAKPCIAPPLTGLDIPYTVYKINAEKGAALDFKTGSKITVPKNCFVDGEGKLVKGEVELHYREFHDAFDFFIAGIPMTYDSAGTRYQFESAGMMEIMGYKDGQPLAVAPDKSINVELASNYEGTQYNLYKLDTGANNWACLGKEKIVRKAENTNAPVIEKTNIQQMPEYKEIETQKEEIKKEKEEKIASFYNAVSEPKKPEQSKKDKYTFNLDVDSKEFPELAVYKGVLFEVGSENKGFNSSMYSTVWDEAVVKDGPEKGKNYMLTLKKASRNYDLVVYPVFEGKNYEAAMKDYQDKLVKYNAALDKRKADEKRLEDEYQAKLAALKRQQQEMELKWKEKQDSQFRQMSADEKVHRVFAISGFGVYNSDCPASYPKGVTCTAKLNNPSEERLMCYNVYLVDKEKNALFTYAKNPVLSFSFNPNSKNLLWTVENGTLYWLKPEQFASIKSGAETNNLKMNKVEQQFKNADEMKAFFNF